MSLFPLFCKSDSSANVLSHSVLIISVGIRRRRRPRALEKSGIRGSQIRLPIRRRRSPHSVCASRHAPPVSTWEMDKLSTNCCSTPQRKRTVRSSVKKSSASSPRTSTPLTAPFPILLEKRFAPRREEHDADEAPPNPDRVNTDEGMMFLAIKMGHTSLVPTDSPKTINACPGPHSGQLVLGTRRFNGTTLVGAITGNY